MIYLRNKTKDEQWLEDPQTGIKRKVAAEALARVSPQMADHALLHEPTKWTRVVAIALAPPPAEDPPG